tara:strand:- start:161 stop:811 length:651 start_codon:yes stop_codon:yes gene_type:complete
MERLLARAGLSRLLTTFKEEELTPELLISMVEGGGWDDAMGELGVDESDASTLRRTLTSSESSSTATGAPAVSASSGQPAFVMSGDLAAALATVAATHAPSAEPAAPANRAFTSEGFNVSHINHVSPETKPASAALAAYQRRQMQQNVQQQQASGAATRPKPQGYSPAPTAPPSVRPIDKFSQGGVVPVPSAASRPDVFGAPPSGEAAVTDENDLD